jgi:Rrf2 family protein
LKLTTRSEYALLALVYLGRRRNEGFVTVEAIANAQQIPVKFLEQILLALKRAHCVRSVKGQHGGYQLAKPPAEITLAEVIRLFDGALAPSLSASRHFHESTPVEREPKLLAVFKEVREFVAEKLERTTIANVL